MSGYWTGGVRSGVLPLYRDLPAGPFYVFNRSELNNSHGIIENWWRQGMMGCVKAQYDCIETFSSETDDQIMPDADSAPLSSMLVKSSAFKSYDRPASPNMDDPSDIIDRVLSRSSKYDAMTTRKCNADLATRGDYMPEAIEQNSNSYSDVT